MRRTNPPLQQTEDDSENQEENEDNDSILQSTSESAPLYDLEYLNSSKDAMDIKLRKYFENMPKHAIIANILDPRVKLRFATLLDLQNSTKVNTTSKKSTSSLKKSNELLFKETIIGFFNLFYLIQEEDDDIGVTPTTSTTSARIFQPKRQLSAFEQMFLSSDGEEYSNSPPGNSKVKVRL